MTVTDDAKDALPQLLVLLERLVGQIEFGSVELIFHHGKLVQLEKNEKLRLEHQPK